MVARLATAVLGLCAGADGLRQPVGPPLGVADAVHAYKDAIIHTNDKPELWEAIGPVAFDTKIVAARLKPKGGDNMEAEKTWRGDRLKSVSAGGIFNEDFSMTRFAIGGTDGKSTAHALAGAGMGKWDGQDKKADFILAASEATPKDMSVVVAVPSKTGKDLDGGLNWGSFRTESSKGHATPEALKLWWDQKTGKVAAATEERSELKVPMEQKEQEVLHVQPKQKSAQVQVEQQNAQAEQTQNQTVAAATEESSSQDAFLFHMMQLMSLNFPQQSAFLFSLFRNWCLDPKHLLSPPEEAYKLNKLEGRWKIVTDLDFPESVGKFMVIKDSRIPSPLGQKVGDVTFRAYEEGRFAGIVPIVAPLNNATINVYRMFKINGTRMEWDDGNVWESAPEQGEPAKPTESPTAPLLKDVMSKLGEVAKEAKSGEKEKVKASVVSIKDAIKKLGDTAKSRAAEHKRQQQQLPKATFSDVFAKLGEAAKSAAAATKKKEQQQPLPHQAGSSWSDVFSQLGDAAKSAAATNKQPQPRPGSNFGDIFSMIGDATKAAVQEKMEKMKQQPKPSLADIFSKLGKSVPDAQKKP